jgi:ethanolamine ammonia-lyase large subunit
MIFTRRDFIKNTGLSAAALVLYGTGLGAALPGVRISSIKPGEDVFRYVKRMAGRLDMGLYKKVIGAANPFKEGDLTVGVASLDGTSRQYARTLIANTRIKDLHEKPLFVDDVQSLTWNSIDREQYRKVKNWTMGMLKSFILSASEAEIKDIMYGLNSDVIGCLVKLMSNKELIEASLKVFNPLPGSKIGARGYMGARIQPNSPTDNIDEIVWQVFNCWSFAVGDVVLGTNPVSSSPGSVARIELALFDLIRTFGLLEVLPNCTLAHIDIQAQVEKQHPGATGIWFQSLGGTVGANRTFDITIEKMMNHAKQRTGKYGLYVETGQGADFTNGHGSGFDMVVHESRKYGFLRALKQSIAEVQEKIWPGPWVHVNDVAGFIGPEVFKYKEQLVRTCLEDTLMGKLHGLTIGLDICSTLHMEVSLDDLDWCISRVMPANPAYLMALPTKNDPMLGYLTTGCHDHVRIREQFAYKVNDAMWSFFKRIGVIAANGRPAGHFGDPIWVYYQYRRAKNDKRSREQIYAEGRKKVRQICQQGVPLAVGYGKNHWEMPPELDNEVHRLYNDAKISIWTDYTQDFIRSIPNGVSIKTTSKNRREYIAHPGTGEKLSLSAIRELKKLRAKMHGQEPDVVIAISDGLNARAIMDPGHLSPFLEALGDELRQAGYAAAEHYLVITFGRVRAGYRCGEILFEQVSDPDAVKAFIHIIGERPGTGHHNFSAYFCAPTVRTWRQKGKVDHNIARVVSGISDTALQPAEAARETVRILKQKLFRGARGSGF